MMTFSRPTLLSRCAVFFCAFALLALGMIVAPVHAAGDAERADLLYDSATGNIKLDHTEAPGGFVTNFVLQSAGEFLAPGNANFPFIGIFKEDSANQISNSDPLVSGWPAASNPWDLGNVAPVGLDQAGLEALFTKADFVGQLGSGVRAWEVFADDGGGGLNCDPPQFPHPDGTHCIPEPTSLALALLGLLGAGVFRRRRTA